MPEKLIEIIDHTNTPRYLMPLDNQKMKMQMKVYGDGDPSDIIPRDQWNDQQDLSGLERYIKRVGDQDGIGSCNACATIYTEEYTRVKMGLKHIPLSAGDLYRRICGGRDQGSMLDDAIKEVSTTGVCTEAVCPYTEWRRKMPSAQAEYKFFKVLEWEWAPTTLELFSACFKGFAANIGIMWGPNDTPNQDGWIPDSTRGGGGHAIMRCIPVFKNGKWGLAGPNSWSTKWGVNGWMVISENRLKSQERDNFGWFVCRQVVYAYPDEEVPQERTNATHSSSSGNVDRINCDFSGGTK